MNFDLFSTEKEAYGLPMAMVYSSLDKIETDDYILSKKSYRYPDGTIEFIRGGFVPGDYVVLYSKKRCCVVMSDTPMERYTNQSLVLNAKGDICILGLGIGMVIFSIIEEQASHWDDEDDEDHKPVKSITIIEKDKALIDLIEPLIRNNIYFEESGIELNIINDDAYEWPTRNKDKHFDLVYADIWDDYHGYEDDVEIFDGLEELYSPICDSFDGWGYADAHGDNPDDESPIERDEYGPWMTRMLLHFHDWMMISDDVWQNIREYAEATA